MSSEAVRERMWTFDYRLGSMDHQWSDGGHGGLKRRCKTGHGRDLDLPQRGEHVVAPRARSLSKSSGSWSAITSRSRKARSITAARTCCGWGRTKSTEVFFKWRDFPRQVRHPLPQRRARGSRDDAAIRCGALTMNVFRSKRRLCALTVAGAMMGLLAGCSPNLSEIRPNNADMRNFHPYPQVQIGRSIQIPSLDGTTTYVYVSPSIYEKSEPFLDPPGTNLIDNVNYNLFDSFGREIPNTLPSTPRETLQPPCRRGSGHSDRCPFADDGS